MSKGLEKNVSIARGTIFPMNEIFDFYKESIQQVSAQYKKAFLRYRLAMPPNSRYFNVSLFTGRSTIQHYEALCKNLLGYDFLIFKKCFFNNGFKGKCDFESHPKPKEVTVSSGGNVTLSCLEKADYYNWFYPWRAQSTNIYRVREDYTTKATQFFSGITFGREITLTNVSYALTGLYSCYNKFYTPCRYTEQKYYLYIRDEDILSVYNTRMFSYDYAVTQYKELEIECIPTSPDVIVDLFIGTTADKELQQKIVLNTLGENKVIYSYNPQKGFKTNDTLVAGIKIYTCKFSRNNKEKSITSRIIIKPLNTTVPIPSVSRITTHNENAINERLILRCTLNTEKNITIEWLTPQAHSDPRIEVSESKNLGVSSSFGLENLNTSDSGVYYCIAKYSEMDFSVNQIAVLLQEFFISFYSSEYRISDLLSIETGVTAEINVEYQAYPSRPDMYWSKDTEQIILEVSPKVSVKFKDLGNLDLVTLTIINVTETDFGFYTLVAKNSKITRNITIEFTTFSEHDAIIEVVDLDLGLVRCIAAAYRQPRVSWYFSPYYDNDVHSFQPISEANSEKNGLQVTSYIKINSTSRGKLLCIASNSDYEDIVYQEVEDPKIDFEIRGPNIVYFEHGEMRIDVNIYASLTLTCAVSLHNYTEEMDWYPTHAYFSNYEEEPINTVYSKYLILTFYNITTEAGDSYTCKVSNKNNVSHSKSIRVVVGDKNVSPNITHSNLDDNININLLLYKEFKLYCNITGFPSPNISWIKDNITLQSSDQFKILDYNQTLLITNFTENEFGVYRCDAVNSEGTVHKEIRLKPSPSFIIDYWYVLFIIIVVMLLLILLFVFTIIKMRKQKKVMKKMGLDNFENGALDTLNPELLLNEQTSALPYDSRWEIPVKNIELGKELGSGEFGIVMKGELKSKNQDERSITVAVKTFKKSSGFTGLKALASELKIMAHLGSHLNIVNLLGAFTKNIAKCELLVIVEYCQFGNLQQYLQNHRQNYINQIDFAGQINFSIGQDILQKRSVPCNKESSEKPKSVTNAMTPLEEASKMSGSSKMFEEVTNDENLELKSSQKDYQNNVTHICTQDLIAWGFQVSRGMEYLSSRKVLHGDLAARNILLADNNIVKICDFGLSKNMYYNTIYQQTARVALPIKWMALESIASRIFSTQSDVWSFGVVLWEFFSLADVPYPTMQVDDTFFRKLSEGYRMDSPEFAPKELYKTMLDCWEADPLLRPSFTALVDRIGAMLEEPIKDCYIHMNNTNVDMNNQTCTNIGQNHYTYANLLHAKENPCDYPTEVQTIEDTDK